MTNSLRDGGRSSSAPDGSPLMTVPRARTADKARRTGPDYGTGGICAQRGCLREAPIPGLYFNRVPSLPATDDGSANRLAEDLSTASESSEDITWDGDTEPGLAEAGEVTAAAGG